MKISCQACEAKYTIADEKVQGKVAKIRCKKCGATIVVNGNASGEAPAADAGDGGLVYTVSVSDGDQRTMSLAEIVTAYNGGEITGDTYVWADGMDDWLPLSGVPSVIEALNGEASPEASRAASRKDRGSKAFDLFGGDGGAPPAAAEPTYESAGTGQSAAAATGARNEQSVLFSLNALLGAERKSAPPAGSKTKDDSGLIDLGALAAKASSDPHPMGMGGGDMMMPMAPMLGAPMLAPPPVSTPAVTSTPNVAAAGNKTGLYVGGAIVFATIMFAGVFVATRPKEQPPVPAAVPTVAPSATETPPAPTATSTAVDPTAVVPAASGTAKVAVGGVKGTGKAVPKGGDKTAPPPTAPPAATPPKPVGTGNCGCPPGDLNCAIKCSATKKK